MLPAKQGLEAHEREVRKTEDWLVMEQQLAAFQRAHQLVFQLMSDAHHLPVPGREQLHVSGTERARLGQGCTGVLQVLFGGQWCRGRAGQPDGSRQVHALVLDRQRPTEMIQDAPAERHQLLVRARAVTEHRELVAADPSGRIMRAETGCYPARDRSCQELEEARRMTLGDGGPTIQSHREHCVSGAV